MSVPAVAILLVASSLAQTGPRRPYNGPQRFYNEQPTRFFGHGPIKQDELDSQKQNFQQWWGDELVTKLADLPAEGKVPDHRVPYAGHDYPDRAGGTLAMLRKYDQAFHGGRARASEYESMDLNDHRNSGGGEEVIRGPFGRVRTVRTRGGGASWYGHCNGWTAAAIRHAEPQKNVTRNGVVFTPADIKGLLAELYMYTDTEFLGGVDPAINPAVLHLTLANWLGRGSYPVGMETAVGEVVINFPIFAYKSVVTKLSPRETEARTTITYTLNVNRETDKSPPKYHRQLYFHYVLDLDEEGNIRGGRYFGDSGQIDMLWVPLKPSQGGSDGNKRGNPHLDVKEVLAIWRESVAEDLRQKWLNIDPTDEDRMLPPSEAVASADSKSGDKPADEKAAADEDKSLAAATSAATTANGDASGNDITERATSAERAVDRESGEANRPAATSSGTPAAAPGGERTSR